MPVVKFTLKDGSVSEVAAPQGESLMRAAVNNDVPGIPGECGGEMSCGTCHVLVAEHWLPKLPRASGDERDLLEISESYQPEQSRLGCQILLTAQLDGIEVEIVGEEG